MLKNFDENRIYRKGFSKTLICVVVAIAMVTSYLIILPGDVQANSEDEYQTGTSLESIEMEAPLTIIDFTNLTIIGGDLDPFIFYIYFSTTPVLQKDTSKLVFLDVLVNSSIYSELSDELDRYANDVERTGLGVKIHTVGPLTSPETIRAHLATEQSSGCLGAFLVGNIAAAWYEMDTQWDPLPAPPKHEEFPIDLFYMDIDGAWGDGDSDGLYDSHGAGSGDIEADIYVGRLRADNMDGDEVTLLSDYFDKNHEFRMGNITYDQEALVYVDDDWQPGTSVKDAVALAFPSYTHVYDRNTTTRVDYLDRLDEGWTAVHVMSHGNPGGHTFKNPNPANWSESIWSGGSVSAYNDVRLMDASSSPVMFYNLFVCSGARHTSSNNLAGWHVLNPSPTLLALGSSKTGSIIDSADFYQPVANGNTVGTSFQSWFADVAERYSNSRPWTYGMTLVGDPTLRMSGKHMVSIDISGLGQFGTTVIDYVEDGTAKSMMPGNGWWTINCDHGTPLSIRPVVGGGSVYTTTDKVDFTVVEPLILDVEYYHQHQVTIDTDGMPMLPSASVSYTQNGVLKSGLTWDSNPFDELCDHGSTVSIENPVRVSTDERYYTEDTDTWTVSADIVATVNYYHQYKWYIEVDTIGLEDLTVSNYAGVVYEFGAGIYFWTLFDGFAITPWINEGTNIAFDLESSGSGPTHRWRTLDPVHIVNGPGILIQNYWEQYLCSADVTGTCLSDNGVYGWVNFEWFGIHKGEVYDDLTDWSQWCNAGTDIEFFEIVKIDACNRCHTNDTVLDTVISSKTYPLEYHHEIKITIMAEGLPDSQSTQVTIGTANPSPSDMESGGDQDHYVVTLDSGNSFTWTNWVHFDTTMTATEVITVAMNEKYLLICWSEDGMRHAPPTVNADEAGFTYTAHYIGLKKEMSKDIAHLTEPVMVYINVSGSSCMEPGDTFAIVDNLANEFSYVPCTCKVDGMKAEPLVEEDEGCGIPFQKLTFELGEGDHEIVFEVRINRAHAVDRLVYNRVSATVDLNGLDPIDVTVTDQLLIKVYYGPTLSSHAKGIRTLFMMDHGKWEFTFIVKNNYASPMMNAWMYDRFDEAFCPSPVFCFNPTILANLLTEPDLNCIYGMMPPTLYWSLDFVAPGEAFMVQFTLKAEMEPTITYGHWWMPQYWNLDNGAMLTWDGEGCYDPWIMIRPMRVRIIPFQMW